MDEVAFLNYLKMQKKSQATIDQYTRFIKEFNSYMDEHKININLASPKDLKEYYKQLTRDLKQTSVNRHL
jgi:site-specific recombinase XerD